MFTSVPPADDTITELINWILQYATAHDKLGDLLSGVGERLASAGMPLWRASLDLPTIDPNARAVTYKWWRDRAIDSETIPHGPDRDEVFQKSVIYHLMSRGLLTCRWRLEHEEGTREFSLLAALREAGATDYLMQLVPFGENDSTIRGVAVSMATDRRGGFTEHEIAALARLYPALGLAAYRISAAHTAENALSVYLGPKTAIRVLAGDIRRGEGQRILAAILFADLRGFSALSAREDATRVVQWLNEHFEAIGDAITAHGGEILKFLGDGILAVFPVEDADGWPCDGCETALLAAEDALRANTSLNGNRLRHGEPALPVDIALHYGELVYGNVGARRRLDFTVIGRAVNEAVRMESLCSEFDRSIIVSQVFADRCSRPLVMVGERPLRGIEGQHVVYGL